MLERARNVTNFLLKEPARTARIGQTPNAIIHRDNKAAVRYFAPAVVKHAPLFICMPLINTWTIFDLMPGRSVVEALLNAGVPVYLMDWGRPGPEDQEVSLSHIIDVVIPRALDRVRRHARVREIDVLGYCVGGTFLTIAVSRMTGIRRLALLATPIDFHASGRLSKWAQPETFPLDTLIDGYGNFPAEMMKASFAWLRPMGQSAKWKSLWERIDQPGFSDVWASMEKWNDDATDFCGEAYREYVRGCYFDNALMKGGWTLGARPVRLSDGKVPAFVMAASDDHIVPPAAAFALEKVWGGPVTTRKVKGGHVAVCIGKELPAALIEWVKEGAAKEGVEKSA